MSLQSYSDLITEIGNWLNRSDLSSEIPTFIRLFEARMNRKLRTPDQEVSASITLLTNVNTYALPSSVRQVKSVFATNAAGVGAPLTGMSHQRLMDDFPSTATGITQAYAIQGTSLVIAPYPDGISSGPNLTVVGYNTVPQLDGTTNTSNWLFASHPDAYLYGALTEAAAYLRDDEHLELWRSALDDVLEDILKEANQRKIPMGPLRTLPAIWE